MHQIYPFPYLLGQPSFGQIAHSAPVTRCCSIHTPNLPSCTLSLFELLLSIQCLTLPCFLTHPMLLQHTPCPSYFIQNHQGVSLMISNMLGTSRTWQPLSYTDDELLHLLCTGIKRGQGDTSRQCLPITIKTLKALNTQLWNDSHKPSMGSLELVSSPHHIYSSMTSNWQQIFATTVAVASIPPWLIKTIGQ